MTFDLVFLFSNRITAIGWLFLLGGLLMQGRNQASPLFATTVRSLLLVGGRVVPIFLSVAYAMGIVLFWGTAQGDFNSLQGLAKLFGNNGILLAGWVHFLAFDLWLGRWQIDALQNYTKKRPIDIGYRPWVLRLLVLPCLLLTFIFGPIGLLVFLTIIRLHQAVVPCKPNTRSDAW